MQPWSFQLGNYIIKSKINNTYLVFLYQTHLHGCPSTQQYDSGRVWWPPRYAALHFPASCELRLHRKALVRSWWSLCRSWIVQCCRLCWSSRRLVHNDPGNQRMEEQIRPYHNDEIHGRTALLTHWPIGDVAVLSNTVSNFQTLCIEWYLE